MCCFGLFMMANGSERERDIAYRKFIPRWDGNPATWRWCRDEVRLWLRGEDVNVPYNLAARVIQNLSGSARRCAMGIPAAELEPRRPSAVDIPVPPDGDGDQRMPMAATPQPTRDDLCAGVNRLLEILENSLQPGPATRKGSAMAEFFAKRFYWRRSGERVSDYITRFDAALQNMRESGFDDEASPDLAGWWFMHMLGLTEERQERVMSALPDEHYDLPLLKRTALRLFADLHLAELQGTPAADFQQRRHDVRSRGQALHASTSQVHDNAQDGLAGTKTTFETGLAGAWADAEDDAVSECDPADFQGFCRSELEVFEGELDKHGGVLDSVVFPGLDVAQVEDAANNLAIASDAFYTVREARHRMSSTSNSNGVSKGKGKGQQVAQDLTPAVDSRPMQSRRKLTVQQSIPLRKARTICRACGEPGHWAGDAQWKVSSSPLLVDRARPSYCRSVYAVDVDSALPGCVPCL